MTLTERLRTLGLAGIVAVAMSGCYDQQYHFNGRIGQEWVVFWEEELGTVHYLKVRKQDKTRITYIMDFDSRTDLQEVIITSPEGKEKRYTASTWNQSIFNEAQKQYNSYLIKILETKAKIPGARIQEGLKVLLGPHH